MSLQNAFLQLMTKWAGRLGSPFAQYRPSSATVSPLSGSPIATLNAIFDASVSLAFNAPSKFNNPLFAAIVDPRLVEPGDYLVSPIGTWFVASTEPLKPILCVSCNRTLTIMRPDPGLPGDNFYGGESPANDVIIMQEFPASILNGTKGVHTETNLPGDIRDPWEAILLPNAPGAIIRAFDKGMDDQGRLYTISSAEQTNLGWRLTAELAET